jgi:winged helix DNA-binding protein
LNTTIAEQRLRNQRITRAAPRRNAADLVAWLGAVQAQEYAAARWGLALRMARGTTDAAIAREFDDGRILRTHVLRPTWHFVTPADIRWMVELTAPHVHRVLARYNRHRGVDRARLSRGVALLEQWLRDGQHLTRADLAVRFERAGLALEGPRLVGVAMYAELEGIICSGPRRGKEFTYALLEERAPGARRLARDEAVAELTRRYFTSHGPATIRDFVWWSGLKVADTKRGLEINRARQLAIDGHTYWTIGRGTSGVARSRVHLLPIYDEYLIAYRDRAAVPHGPTVVRSGSTGGVTFQHALVIDGQIAGTWRTSRKSGVVVVNVTPLRRLTRTEQDGIAETAARYERFLDTPVSAVVRR